MYLFSKNNELKWMSKEFCFFEFDKLNEIPFLKNELILSNEEQILKIKQINNFFSFVSNKLDFKMVKQNSYNLQNIHNRYYLSGEIPGKYTTNKEKIYQSPITFELYIEKLNDVKKELENLKTELDFINLIEDKSFIDNKIQQEIKNNLRVLFGKNTSIYDNIVLDFVNKILNNKKIKQEIISLEQSNPYKSAKAYAIFTGEKDHSGYKTKDGSIGDISIARLFGSDQGAKRTATSMGLTDFDIVEVEIKFSKKMNFTNYDNKKLNEVISEVEKEKIILSLNDDLKELKNNEAENKKQKNKI